MNPHVKPHDAFCVDSATCIRAHVHSGPHLDGCRICHTTDHTITTCPRAVGVTMEPRYEYPYLPPVCRRGDCDHPEKGEGCTRYRYRTCREGTCTHASQGLACAYVEPPKPAPAPAPRRPFQHHDECESPDGGSCTCDLIAEYGDQYDRESH